MSRDKTTTMEQESRESLPARSEKMHALLQRTKKRPKCTPVQGSTSETLKLLRAARAGEMWGYELSVDECSEACADEEEEQRA